MTHDTAQLLTRQIEFVGKLISGDESVKVVNFFVLGEHYSKLRRTDFAALLYYRTIEGAFQQRLRLGYSGFDCGHPDYTVTKVPAPELLERYNQVIGQLGWARVTALPEKMGLISSAVLLHVLKDPLLRRIDIANMKGLSHLVQQAEARNGRWSRRWPGTTRAGGYRRITAS